MFQTNENELANHLAKIYKLTKSYKPCLLGLLSQTYEVVYILVVLKGYSPSDDLWVLVENSQQHYYLA
jgi:hypothetical protein